MFGLSKKPEPLLFKAVWSGDERKARETLAGDLTLINAKVTGAIRKEHPELEEGATAMHLAARRGHTAIVELLLSLHADPNSRSSSGSTPLHFAAMGGHADVASILIEHKVVLDAQDGSGFTPLHRAAASGDEELVELLVSRSAAIGAKNEEGETPLHVAVRAGSVPAAKILLTAGAEIDARDEKGRMPIHSGVIGSVSAPGTRGAPASPLNTEAVTAMLTLLLSYGAQINALDQAGETPFDLLVYLGGKAADSTLIGFFMSRGAQCVRYKSKQPLPQTAPPPFQTAPRTSDTLIGTGFGGTGGTAGASASAATAGKGSPPPAALRPESTSPRTSRSPSSWGSAPIALGDKPITFGRNPDCDIRYMSLTLSHRHARVVPSQGGYVISDLGSRNGVLIDNVKITAPHRLEPNELITLGAYEFEFDGKQLIPTHGEISESDLLAEQKMLEQRRNSSSATGTTLPPEQT